MSDTPMTLEEARIGLAFQQKVIAAKSAECQRLREALAFLFNSVNADIGAAHHTDRVERALFAARAALQEMQP